MENINYNNLFKTFPDLIHKFIEFYNQSDYALL